MGVGGGGGVGMGRDGGRDRGRGAGMRIGSHGAPGDVKDLVLLPTGSEESIGGWEYSCMLQYFPLVNIAL